MKQYWVLRLEYSQTDREYCIVSAENREQALTMQKSNARYVSVVAGPISRIIE